MSSRLFTSTLMRSDEARMACAISACSPLRAGCVSARVSARPTMAASGVRRSCEMAASSELRSRSDSICTVVLCATWM